MGCDFTDDQLEQDWTALSRKHVLEVDAERPHLSIFGGKLTDCINVGREVAHAVERLGVPLRASKRWYGEASPAERQQLMDRARALSLEELDGRREAPAERLWRRYGPRAHELLDRIERDPSQAELLIPGAEVLRVEATHAAQHERVVELEDFLRRRTMIEQLVPRAALLRMPQLPQLAELLFGDDAPARLEAYRRGASAPADPPKGRGSGGRRRKR